MEIDVVRTAKVALICYRNGIFSYILCAASCKIGNIVSSGFSSKLKCGNNIPLWRIKKGMVFFGIAMKEGGKAIFCRTGGNFSQTLRRIGNYIVVKLRSGEHRLFHIKTMVTLGIVGRAKFLSKKRKKSGFFRKLGRRPIVRGVAMNPIDHPHGGNTGHSGVALSPWAKLAKGGKTKKKLFNSVFIIKNAVRKKRKKKGRRHRKK